MSSNVPRIPSYRRHRASGQAVVTLNGVDHYLGRWNSPESKAQYDRVINEWLVRGRKLDSPGAGVDSILVEELVNGYWSHVSATLPDVEAVKVKLALKPVRQVSSLKVDEVAVQERQGLRRHACDIATSC